jgi:predicted amidohydrolase
MILRMRLTVCELPENRTEFERAWNDLVDHVAAEESDLVLLPEMPFAPWLAATADDDPDAWKQAVDTHDEWIARLDALSPATVLVSRPTIRHDRRLNEGLRWTQDNGAETTHEKRYLPEEEGFWEASWYDSGQRDFSLVECAGAQTGFLICTDLWAVEEARAYGQDGAHLIANPRATEARTLEKWRVGGQATGVVSGAFVASSNRVTVDDQSNVLFGGEGWIVDPDGTMIARTSRTQPFVTVDIDLAAAEQAKETYPRPAFN